MNYAIKRPNVSRIFEVLINTRRFFDYVGKEEFEDF